MNLSKLPYRGTRDFFPTQKRIQDYIFNIMKKTAFSFGYEHYDGPLLEEVDLYKAKSGSELINDQIYSFTDRGERFVAIRPEMTPTVARMVAQIHREVPKPLRWFSIPNLMRYEKPQRGRLREHWQFNVDIFGAPGFLGEIEILQLAVTLLHNYGATETMFEILLNDRRFVEAVFTKLLQLNQDQSYQLYKVIDRAKKVSQEALNEMVSKILTTQNQKDIFSEYLKLTTFQEAITFTQTHQIAQDCNDFVNLVITLESLSIAKYVVFDPTIVRGLDYYTGIVFEIFDKHPENKRALCGGGAYANLLKIFNEDPLPGVGLGLGDVTLTDFLTVHNLLPDFSNPTNDLFLTAQDPEGIPTVLQLAQQLRSLGLNVITHLDPIKFKKVFPLAEKRGASFVGFIGLREVQEQMIVLKNMKTSEQHSLSTQVTELQNIVTTIKI